MAYATPPDNRWSGFFSGGQCTIYANFKDSGGIFTNAEVTYRGVAVGRVGELKLLDDGVQVALDVDDCNSAKIPTDTKATVSDRSVIGEQYVNLVPPDDGHGKYLAQGETIPMSRTSIQVAPETRAIEQRVPVQRRVLLPDLRRRRVLTAMAQRARLRMYKTSESRIERQAFFAIGQH